MDTDFWHERWHRSEIAFHRADVHPLLERHWRTCVAERAADVLVPLCGKSLDMRWLARQGHSVSGVEVDRRAVTAFFREWGVAARTERRRDGLEQWSGAGVRLVAGDFFALRPEPLPGAFYDRAALVALPPEMRPGYLRHLAACLEPGAPGLLIAFEYEPEGFAGPPFSVSEAEVRDQPWFRVECLARHPAGDTYPGLVAGGALALHEVVYRLERTPAPAAAAGAG